MLCLKGAESHAWMSLFAYPKRMSEGFETLPGYIMPCKTDSPRTEGAVSPRSLAKHSIKAREVMSSLTADRKTQQSTLLAYFLKASQLAKYLSVDDLNDIFDISRLIFFAVPVPFVDYSTFWDGTRFSMTEPKLCDEVVLHSLFSLFRFLLNRPPVLFDPSAKFPELDRFLRAVIAYIPSSADEIQSELVTLVQCFADMLPWKIAVIRDAIVELLYMARSREIPYFGIGVCLRLVRPFFAGDSSARSIGSFCRHVVPLLKSSDVQHFHAEFLVTLTSTFTETKQQQEVIRAVLSSWPKHGEKREIIALLALKDLLTTPIVHDFYLEIRGKLINRLLPCLQSENRTTALTAIQLFLSKGLCEQMTSDLEFLSDAFGPTLDAASKAHWDVNVRMACLLFRFLLLGQDIEGCMTEVLAVNDTSVLLGRE